MGGKRAQQAGCRPARLTVATMLVLATNAASAASTMTVRMIQPIGSDVPGIFASVIAAEATATTYGMACGTSFPEAGVQGYPKSVICSSIAELTITQGPQTLAFTTPTMLGAGPTMQAGLECKLAPKEAVCTKHVGAEEGKTLTITGGVPLGDVVVTAGIEKLSAVGATKADSVPAGIVTPTGDAGAIGAKSGAAPKSTGTSKAAAAPTDSSQSLMSGLAAVVAGVVGLIAL